MTRRVLTKKAALDCLETPGLGPWMLMRPGCADLLPYAVGDRLWVRENCWERPDCTQQMLRDGADTWARVHYDADGIDENERDVLREWRFRRRPPIHMPRWASRLTLLVTGVKVERLQEIGGEDALAEGVEIPRCGCEVCARSATICTADASEAAMAFAELWDSINGPGAWEANPFVAAITFKTVKANIDHLPAEAA